MQKRVCLVYSICCVVEINISVTVLSSVWQWKGDEGQWEPYPPSACAQLDSALSSGDATVSLTFGSGAAYDVDLKKMVQVNTVTKYKRKIRSHTLKPG